MKPYNKLNLVGSRFGKLVVIREEPTSIPNTTMWYCECDCGGTKITSTHNLRSGDTKSCGCIHREKISRDLTGKRFGRLTVIRNVGLNSRKSFMWECKCDCGNIVTIATNALTSGNTRSCGCLCRDVNHENLIKRNTKYFDEISYILSRRILGMKSRCYNKNCPSYPNYGARGIRICDEWLNNTQSFIDWAKSHGFKKGLTIDRINNDGPYSPENCRCVDYFVQSNNRRSNHLITLRRSTKTVAQWAHALDIPDKWLKWLYSEPDHIIRQKLIDRLEEIIREYNLQSIRDIDEILRVYSKEKNSRS